MDDASYCVRWLRFVGFVRSRRPKQKQKRIMSTGTRLPTLSRSDGQVFCCIDCAQLRIDGSKILAIYFRNLPEIYRSRYRFKRSWRKMIPSYKQWEKKRTYLPNIEGLWWNTWQGNARCRSTWLSVFNIDNASMNFSSMRGRLGKLSRLSEHRSIRIDMFFVWSSAELFSRVVHWHDDLTGVAIVVLSFRCDFLTGFEASTWHVFAELILIDVMFADEIRPDGWSMRKGSRLLSTLTGCLGCSLLCQLPRRCW